MRRRYSYPEIWPEPPPGPVLVVAPHPDDETIGCGGMIALHRRHGDRVHVVVVTDGAAGDPESRYPREDYVERRRDECRAATALLDLDEPPEFLGFPDRGTTPGGALRRALADVVERVAPAVVYHPPAPEMHPDHHVVGGEVMAVTAHRRGCRTFAFETWVAVVPTHVIDVTSVWDVKQKAIACFPSQLAYVDYGRASEGLATYRAIFLPGAERVEAFAETTRGAHAVASGRTLFDRLLGRGA